MSEHRIHNRGNWFTNLFRSNRDPLFPHYGWRYWEQFTDHYHYITAPSYQDFTDAVDKGYSCNDSVYSIIRKIASAVKRSPFGVHKVRSEKSLKDYHQSVKDGAPMQKIRSLKDISIFPTYHPLTNIFNDPNELMSGADMLEASVSYRLITGNSYKYLQWADGVKRVIGVHILPSQHVSIITDGHFPVSVMGYHMDGGHLRRFAPREVIHTKMFNPNYDVMGSQLYGLSPLEPAWHVLNADNEAMGATHEQLKNRGARKLVGIDNDKVRDYAEGMETMKKLSEVFNDRTNVHYKDRVAPIWGRIQVEDIGLSLSEMGVMDVARFTFSQLCNIYGVPEQIFNTGSESKYSNLEQYYKYFIANVVIPELIIERESWNRWARKERLLSDDYVIDFDPTVYPELEMDKSLLMDWMKDSPLSLDQQLIYLGEQPSGLPNMNEPLVSRSKMPVSKLGEDLLFTPNGSNDYNRTRDANQRQ